MLNFRQNGNSLTQQQMKLPEFFTDEIISQKCPPARLGTLLCKVNVAPASPQLTGYIATEIEKLREKLALEDIHHIGPLAEARTAYKALGKDPSRYRPSAEALLRRVVQGKDLYEVSNVVDALNLVSVSTGYSIGGYDLEKISGTIRFGRGEADEPYEAIGRGLLNIENLPLLRDDNGAFGCPTSDSLRTMVTPATTWFLAVFFDFGGNENLEMAEGMMAEWLERFADGEVVPE
jgi:DNA/RNA-binding domain of Phe-tRNA-synthetase-like protein